MRNQSFISGMFIGLAVLIFAACASDEVQAEESLEGTWNVVDITSYYGEFSETTFNAAETVSESGQLGTFTFSEDSVSYEFIRNDTTYAGSREWLLDLEKVRSGFHRENQFTLTIENRFLFEVAFEDQTRNAEKDATSATFGTMPEGNISVYLQMELEKQ